jgi:hypothetical protein
VLGWYRSLVTQSDAQIVAAVVQSAFNLAMMGLPKLLTNDAFELFRKAEKLGLYLGGLFQGIPAAYAYIIGTPEFIRGVLEFSQSGGKIYEVDDVEKLLSSFQFCETALQDVIKLAFEYKLLSLALKFSVSYLQDLVPVAALFDENGRLGELVERVFSESPENPLRGFQSELAVWILWPDSRGEFSRLKGLIEKNLGFATQFLTSVLGFLPLQAPDGGGFRDRHFIDVVLHTVHSLSYEQALPLIGLVLPLVPTREVPFTGASLPHIVRWIFTGPAHPSVRESVLECFLAQYPNLLPDDKLSAWCEGAGFLRAVIRVCLPKKNYAKIVTSMLLNQEPYKAIFDFLEEHISDRAEVKRALATTFTVLVLLSPEHTFDFVNKYFTREHREFIDLLPPQNQFLYIRALLDHQDDDSFLNLMFKLTCRYDPQNAARFLVKYIDLLDIDAAEREATQTGCIACLITLKIRVQKYVEAVEQIGREIERTLMNLVMSDLQVKPTSIDQLADLPALAEPMETIRVAIDLLVNVTPGRQDAGMLWQKVYLGFQLPVFVCAKKSPAVNAAVTLMFAYFLVISLNSLTANHVFLILAVHFRMEPQQFREILTNVFRRIDYQRNLYGGVEQLLVEDTIELVETVYGNRARGVRSSHEPICGKCSELLARTAGSVRILPCGHCFHDHDLCRLEGPCPVCAGEKAHRAVVQESTAPRRVSPTEYRMLMNRMDFRLRQDLGRAGEGIDSGIYFADREEQESRTPVKLVDIKPTERVVDIAALA